MSLVFGISKNGLAETFPTFFSDPDRLKLKNTRKVDANVWWVIVT